MSNIMAARIQMQIVTKIPDKRHIGKGVRRLFDRLFIRVHNNIPYGFEDIFFQ